MSPEKVDTTHHRPRLLDRGVTPENKAIVVPKENLFLSKEQFVAKQKAQKEKNLKMEEFSKQYDAEAQARKKAKEEEIEKGATQQSEELAPEIEKAKRGRPKKRE